MRATLKLEELRYSQSPPERVLHDVFAHAANTRASDIHLEYESHGPLSIYLRIDKDIQHQKSIPNLLARNVISHIKSLANLDTTQKQKPQDGRFQLKHNGRTIDFRVSTVPVQGGESIVLRILDKEHFSRFTLDELGMNAEIKADVLQWRNAHHGMFLVTGPTGSGKTTTLYTLLKEVDTLKKKVLTAEDPVEYSIEGAIQVNINDAHNLTFARTLRAFLRQDPDIIFVGEIRDKETAQIAIQAALTGHLVFSTLHTADAPSAILRLLDLGIKPYLIAAALRGVLAQRLVKIDTGLTGTFDILQISEPLRELILKEAPLDQLRSVCA